MKNDYLVGQIMSETNVTKNFAHTKEKKITDGIVHTCDKKKKKKTQKKIAAF